MQYIKQPDGSFALLPKQNVDFGGGLERIAAVSENKDDIFLVDVFTNPIRTLEVASGKHYVGNEKAFRVVLDHMRAAVFLLADGIVPSNTERGYLLRRLLRRAVRFANKLGTNPNITLTNPDGGFTESTLARVAEEFIHTYDNAYHLIKQANHIISEIKKEEERFRTTLQRGMRELERFTQNGSISAQDAFQLVTTYGFPLELILEEAGEKGIRQVDIEGFKELLKQHQDLSRAGSEQKFKGGLADTSEKTTRLHTAHHLLLKALQQVLGSEVHQRGSNITQERLRIDFSYGAKMTDEQKKEVERIVNEKIKEDLAVVRTEMAKEEAEKLGAEHEFGAKYPDRVSVYSVGPLDDAFSIEFCGGPHVEHTAELSESGTFKIQKEEAVSAGVRRIKAVLQ